MPTVIHNGGVVLTHPPDWSFPVEWNRTWDTRIDAALTGAEYRLGTRPVPRESIRFRIVPFDLTDRLQLVHRLRVAVKSGLAIVPNWGRVAHLADTAAAGSLSLTLEADTFQAVPGQSLFVGMADDETNTLERVQVTAHAAGVLTLLEPLLSSHPAGSAVHPSIEGRIVVSDLDAWSDWHQAVTVEVRQLRTAFVVDVPVEPDPGQIGSDHWLDGVLIQQAPNAGTFHTWLDGAPVL